MKKFDEIMQKYTAGEMNAEQANAALKAAGVTEFHLDPDRNVLTEEQKRATTVGYYPEQANGWGFLDDGIKLELTTVKNGILESCDAGDSLTYFYICARKYQVKGKKLVDYDE